MGQEDGFFVALDGFPGLPADSLAVVVFFDIVLDDPSAFKALDTIGASGAGVCVSASFRAKIAWTTSLVTARASSVDSLVAFGTSDTLPWDKEIVRKIDYVYRPASAFDDLLVFFLGIFGAIPYLLVDDIVRSISTEPVPSCTISSSRS